VLDVSRLNDLGWSPSYDLDRGIRTTYQWFLEQQSNQSALRGISEN
jgi:GDP-L-fucose synthase